MSNIALSSGLWLAVPDPREDPQHIDGEQCEAKSRGVAEDEKDRERNTETGRGDFPGSQSHSDYIDSQERQ